jgi:hypothetical protein
MAVGFVTPRAKPSVRTENSDLHFGHFIATTAGPEAGVDGFISSEAPPFVFTSACADVTRLNTIAMLVPMMMLRSVFICLSFSFAFRPSEDFLWFKHRPAVAHLLSRDWRVLIISCCVDDKLRCQGRGTKAQAVGGNATRLMGACIGKRYESENHEMRDGCSSAAVRTRVPDQCDAAGPAQNERENRTHRCRPSRTRCDQRQQARRVYVEQA